MKKETTTIRRRSSANLTPAPVGVKAGRFKLYSLMFVSLLVVVSGVFFAGRQHFSSIDYSMRNSKLRKQLEDLESEKRRLLLAREVSLSPSEIKKAVHRLGVDSSAPNSAQLASAKKDVKAVTPQLASAKTAGDQPQYVVRTSYVASTTRIAAAGPARPNAAKKEVSTTGAVSRSAE